MKLRSILDCLALKNRYQKRTLQNEMYSSYSLPTGTRYLKIKFRNQSANYWSPQISNVELKTKDKLSDGMNDFLKMWTAGSNLTFDTTSPASFSGDTSRVTTPIPAAAVENATNRP